MNRRAELLELQRVLLPPVLPAIGCTEAAAHYRSHNHDLDLGGDWYDLVDRPDDQVVAIVGDVVGHGVSQIGVMGQLRAASNALARTLPQPADVLTSLDAFAADVPGAAYASAMVLMLDGTTTGRIAAAGHPPLLHVSASGVVDVVEAGRGPLLGVSGERPGATFTYGIDDLLVMYTDGLVERRRGNHDIGADVGRFVAGRLDEPCDVIAAEVVDRFGADSDDDIVVLVLRPRNHRSPDYLLRPLSVPSIRFD
ncbi:MAG: serine/threonine-protein phosphatase [Ilumatobacter sp.]|nr:serine/threonine-protein phosphatase [Ilumatobacter sp.]